MFLKTVQFSHCDVSVTLYELSALQRMDYLAYLYEETAAFETQTCDADDDNKKQLAWLKLRFSLNIWLVAHSLWNADTTQDITLLIRDTSQGWGWEALDKATEKVLQLSGMLAENDRADDDNEGAEPTKPDTSAEKP